MVMAGKKRLSLNVRNVHYNNDMASFCHVQQQQNLKLLKDFSNGMSTMKMYGILSN